MSQIVDVYGRPIQRASLREQQTALLSGLHSEYAEHLVRNLTPVRLARILQDAEEGQLKSQAELFMDMEERDAHLFAEMSKRKRALLGLDWTVEPPRNATPAEKADAEFLHELLLDLEGLDDLLLDLLDGIGHGFSCVELEWQRYGNEWQPAGFHHRPQSWFITRSDNQNQLLLRTNTATVEELRPFNWIVHTPRARSGYLGRAGLYRVLAWPYLFKHYSVRDMAELLEIYGVPLRLGMYPPGTSDAEKATLLNAVTRLGHSAAGIIPETMKIEFQNAALGAAEPFLAMVEQCDASISKAILGGTLTSQTSSSGGGAFALGQVHNEVRHDLLRSDARQLAATLSRDLLWPLLVMNRGANLQQDRMPRFVFDLKETGDIEAMASALPALVNIGTRVPSRWANEYLGIPLPDADEPALAPLGQPAAALTKQPQKLAALSALVQPTWPDQAAVDRVLEQLPVPAMQEQIQQMLEPLLHALQNGADEQTVLGLLADAYPEMDDDMLTDALHKLLFAADTFGRLTGV